MSVVEIKKSILNQRRLEMLVYLAEHGQAYQQELNDQSRVAYSTTLADLEFLQDYGAVFWDYDRVEPKKGKKRKYQSITLKGILHALKKDINLLDKIAGTQKNIWVFFDEWKYVKKHSVAREDIEKVIRKYVSGDISRWYVLDGNTISLELTSEALHMASPVGFEKILSYYFDNKNIKDFSKWVLYREKRLTMRKRIGHKFVEDVMNKDNSNLEKLSKAWYDHQYDPIMLEYNRRRLEDVLKRIDEIKDFI